jgi:hypothetical protein
MPGVVVCVDLRRLSRMAGRSAAEVQGRGAVDGTLVRRYAGRLTVIGRAPPEEVTAGGGSGWTVCRVLHLVVAGPVSERALGGMAAG